MKSKVFWSLFILGSFTLAGCGASQSSDWNDYFRLFQEGAQYQGRIVHVTPSQIGAVIQVEYQDASGVTKNFVETWPSDQAQKVQTGDAVAVYALAGDAKVKEATLAFLKQKKIT